MEKEKAPVKVHKDKNIMEKLVIDTLNLFTLLH